MNSDMLKGLLAHAFDALRRSEDRAESLNRPRMTDGNITITDADLKQAEHEIMLMIRDSEIQRMADSADEEQ